MFSKFSHTFSVLFVLVFDCDIGFSWARDFSLPAFTLGENREYSNRHSCSHFRISYRGLVYSSKYEVYLIAKYVHTNSPMNVRTVLTIEYPAKELIDGTSVCITRLKLARQHSFIQTFCRNIIWKSGYEAQITGKIAII